MGYITTFTGKHFNPLDPKPDLLDLVDIAHALSLTCRAAGHVKTFYSVGQHSIACAREAEARGYSQKVKLLCLLHDASEAYLVDVPRPLKPELGSYLKIEEKLLDMIWVKFVGSIPNEDELRKIKEIDDQMMSYEFLRLMPEELDSDYDKIISRPSCKTNNPQNVEADFLRDYLYYMRK